jgi:hypothetical protein
MDYNFGAPVMPIQPWLGYQDPYSFFSGRFAHVIPLSNNWEVFYTISLEASMLTQKSR